ncbi:MAG: hypothetical protein JKY51_02360 [Opitutaceae bacterium]|nr:hypothetical protein [Opitutaceae bacterium]
MPRCFGNFVIDLDLIASGVFANLEDGNIMAKVFKAKEDTETLTLVRDFHSQHVPAKMLAASR